MRYLFYRAFHKLYINKKIYFIIALELAIGVAVVLCGVYSAHSADSKLTLCRRQIGEGGGAIEYSIRSGFSDAELPVTVDDYENIKKSHSGLDISYMLYAHSIYLTRELSDVRDVTFVSMDTKTFCRYFGFAPQDDTVYLGAQVADDFENDGLTFFEKWFSLDFSSDKPNVRIGDPYIADIMDIVKLNSSDTPIFAAPLVDLDVDSMIILPEKCMRMLELNAGDILIPCLRIMSISDEGEPSAPSDLSDPSDLSIPSDLPVSSTLSEIVKMLQDKHPAYSYRIAEQYLNLQKSITDLTQSIRFFSWIAWFALIITMVGIIGILMIYMEKRMREFAIILALGGTATTIYVEIFLEVFMICLVGGCIGLMASIIAVPCLSTSVFTAHFHLSGVFVMFGIVLMITVISCACMILGIRRSK